VRILHISSSKVYGEAERHIVCLCRELASRGHDVFVALRPTSEWHDAVAFLPTENVLQVSIRNSFGMFSARRIARFIDRNNIEIVHAHAAKDYLAGSVVRRAAKNVRLVLTRHVARPLKPFHRFALRSVDAAIGMSPDVTDDLRLTFGREKIFSAVEGFDVGPRADYRHAKSAAFREFHSIPEKAPMIVTISDLGRSSGHRDLVLAAAEAAKSLPDVFYVVAGNDPSGDRRHRRELKRLAKVLGVDDRFRWLDEPLDISDLLAAADLFVSMAYSDKLGWPLYEAIAAGVPLIACGSGDMLPAKCYVPAHEPIKLAARIFGRIQDPAAARDTAMRLQAAVREQFSIERMTDDIEAVYRKVLTLP
jgi:glycosyltransferase involved in cell wall biosynthesis